MEVDDAAQTEQLVSAPLDHPKIAPNKNGREDTPVRRTGRRWKEQLGAENADETNEPQVQDLVQMEAGEESNITDTPFKLEVSDTEGDESVDSTDVNVRSSRARAVQNNGKTSPRRQLLKSPDITNVCTTQKRKRQELRRSGSGEYLLGFDELSGEAEMVSDLDMHNKDFEQTDMSPSQVTSAPKKMKQSPTDAAASTNKTSPRGQASPASTPPRARATKTSTTLSMKHEDPPLKPHIVADIEGPETPTAASVPAATVYIQGTPIPQGKKPLSVKDDYYKKPFDYGWKRELVYRANIEASKDKADVYFITPSGKKLRTRSDIAPLLEGDLTLDHFSFAREPIGVGPEFETVRSAKPSHRATVTAATLAAATAPPAHPGKRISKPKVPKGASPPPQGWTPTRALKTNNAALLNSAGSSKHSGSNPSTPPSSRTNTGSSNIKNSKTKRPTGSADAASLQTASHDPCSMMCAQARGQIPQLQCVKCLCLYHHECVGLSRQHSEYHVVGEPAAPGARDYVCESCLPHVKKADAAKINTATSTAPAPAATSKLLYSKPPQEAAAVRAPSVNKLPQTIAVVKGKKYVMVAKPNAAPVVKRTVAATAEHMNDIENDLKQINESMRSSRKHSMTSLEAAFQPHAAMASDVMQRSFATNFFANVSFAYDALLCILKYLKIHERPRAASVCKLWHLAAKDTSLWQTVRMKNSRISDWAGFAAALRRGETKHLDLRKMLLSNTKADEMWQDFSTCVGSISSLQTIDLCRCSANVVEGLFKSNQQLRVLNALAINDESFSLTHIENLQQLTELRMRTCEPGTLDGDLWPLQTLTHLSHLSMTSLLGLGTKSIEVLGELENLRSLELGECGDFDSNFAQSVLPKLVNLQRLRLENGQKTSCCTLEILDAAAKLEQLSQLEFVNFDIKPGFDAKLQLCTNIRKLLIIPTYISQSATTNQIVLHAVQQLSETLQVFTWGVTVELLRVTALYVDQCEESTKKEKHHFDECIPVMKPVPGAPPSDSQEEQLEDIDELGANAVPQIEILPLDKVECILGDIMTNTKYTIVKVPYQATCRQQLVE